MGIPKFLNCWNCKFPSRLHYGYPHKIFDHLVFPGHACCRRDAHVVEVDILRLHVVFRPFPGEEHIDRDGIGIDIKSGRRYKAN